MLVCPAAWAHPRPQQLEVPEAAAAWRRGPVVIDGLLDETAWRQSSEHGAFVERKPKLRGKPPERTRFFILYDAEAVYFGVICEDSQPGDIQADTLGRDRFTIFRDDAISIKLDVTHDHRSTMGFALNPAGARLDYRGVNEQHMAREFDAVWQGAARKIEAGWSAELRIPFTELGVAPGAKPRRLGLNLSRDHARRNATYDWAVMPPPFSPLSASRYGHLLLPPGAQKKGAGTPHRRTYALTPYLLLGVEEAAEAPEAERWTGRWKLGGDARLDLASGWRGSLTVNTDFAQVDLDDQVINLGRFELFMPEKRSFFLQDMELFAFGLRQRIQPIYTRQIGLHDGAEVPIAAGLRISGLPSKSVRVGLLDVMTVGTEVLPWTNHLVGRVLVEKGEGSNLGTIIASKNAMDGSGQHNLVLGADGAWRGVSNPLLLSGFVLMSVDLEPVSSEDQADLDGSEPATLSAHRGAALGLDLHWRDESWRPKLSYSFVSEDFRADQGFVRRPGVHSLETEFVWEQRPSWAQTLTAGAVAGGVMASDGSALLDQYVGAGVGSSSHAGYNAGVRAGFGRQLVEEGFEIGSGTEIAAGEYTGGRVTLGAGTPGTYDLAGGLGLSMGNYYDGRSADLQAHISVQPGPWLRLDARANLTWARFEDGSRDFDSTVLNARAVIGLSPDLGLDLFAGWNQLERLAQGQIRLRWSYASGSDCFVVYAQARETDWRMSAQSLVAKVNYRW